MAFLKTTSNGDILTIYFAEGKILDAVVIQSISDELLALLGRTEEPNILLDFRAVKFLSSAALGMLVRAQKRSKELKINLKLSNFAPSIREVFKITGLDRVLEIYADAEDARLAFSKKGRIL
jgi:anti-sigma B factor antagonist